jgi:hypothetical protein
MPEINNIAGKNFVIHSYGSKYGCTLLLVCIGQNIFSKIYILLNYFELEVIHQNIETERDSTLYGNGISITGIYQHNLVCIN